MALKNTLMNLELYLVRHGKTVFNTLGRLQGWSDSPLTSQGREVAHQLGLGLQNEVHFDAAFCSVSPRAAETAKIILAAKGQADLTLNVVEEVREYCFGGFEGELMQVLHETIVAARGLPDVATWLAHYRDGSRNLLAESVSQLDPLGLAETESDFITRLRRGLAEIVTRSPQGARVLLVSHGMAITGILKSIDPNSTPYQSVANASVSRLRYKDSKWTIESVGETRFGGEAAMPGL